MAAVPCPITCTYTPAQVPVFFARDGWKAAFSPRDLVALSVQPLLIYPTHYTGEPGYITDTEDSDVIDLMPAAAGAQPGSHPGDREERQAQGALPKPGARGVLAPDTQQKQEL